MAKFTKVNIKQIEDAAAKHGYADHHEARFASKPLGLEKSGLSYQHLFAGQRSLFGHKHREQEEIFLVLGGNGKMKLDDEEIELAPWDAVRVPPGVMSALAAGPKGLEFLVFGAPQTPERDWEMVNGWWN